MRLLSSLLVAVILMACNSRSANGKRMAGSDSLIINFNNPGSNTIAKTVTTTETKAIEKLAGFADSKATEAYKCGYDGNLMFYKDGQLMADVAFNYSGAGCQHFIQEVDGKLYSTSMSHEAIDFLQSLAAGKDWY